MVDVDFAVVWSVLRAASSPLVAQIQLPLKLEDNAKSLFNVMEDLRDAWDDMERNFLTMENGRMERTSKVRRWEERVKVVEEQVLAFKACYTKKRDLFLCCCCPASLFPVRCRLGKKAHELLKRVRCLEGQFENLGVLVTQSLPRAVQEIRGTTSAIIGREEMMSNTISDIFQCFKAGDVGIMGIYGMGGIGKTTLLKEINEILRLCGVTDFQVVIFIEVSSKLDVERIQDQIADRIGLLLALLNPEERANALFTALSCKRFLLLMDDVWEKLDLNMIGVPEPNKQNNSKLVFTSRSEDVCSDMGVQKKFKMGLLNKEKSWELFCKQTCPNEHLYEPALQPLVETVVDKCGGLPLAIITIGRAVAKYIEVGQWENAIDNLKNSPNEIRGMEDVMTLLKFSYDNLDSEETKLCFLYCCLFPENHSIFIELLVNYWIGERLLDDKGGRREIIKVRNKGLVVINKLKSACLLEDDGSQLFVRMHDAIRDMGIWKAGEDYVVYGKMGGSITFDLGRWSKAKCVSLMYGDFDILPKRIPTCPNLVILLVNRNPRLHKVPKKLFHSVPFLRILDLSYTRINEIPETIDLLTELHYLNARDTLIERIPEQLGNLKKLVQLDLSRTKSLMIIPRKALLGLPMLVDLKLMLSSYDYGCTHFVNFKESSKGFENNPSFTNLFKFDDFDCLKQLEVLGVHVRSISNLQMLSRSRMCSRAMQRLALEGDQFTNDHLSSAFKTFQRLQTLFILRCPQLNELEFGSKELKQLVYLLLVGLQVSRFIWQNDNKKVVPIPIRGIHLQTLRFLRIKECHELREIGWIVHIINLETLIVTFCDKMAELFKTKGGERDMMKASQSDGNNYREYFHNLRYLTLECLPNLSSITSQVFKFPSLRRLQVIRCPNLKRLPFSSKSAKDVREIRGEQNWWNNLQWDDGDTEFALFPYFLKSSEIVMDINF